MYRNDVEIRTDDHVNFLLLHGALGDAISSLPAVVWARRHKRLDTTMAVWCAAYQVDLFRHLLGEFEGLTVQPLTEYQAIMQRGDDTLAGPNSMNCSAKNTITRNKMDLAVYGHVSLLDRQPDSIEDLEYPHWAPLGERKIEGDYVAIPVGATNEASTLQASVLKPYVEWLLAQGLKPVLTGRRGKTGIAMLSQGRKIDLVVHDKVDELPEALLAKCVDLRDKTTLLELRDVLGYARVVAGIDGGSLHLAGTTYAPIIYATTRVDPRHRGIVREGEMNFRLLHIVPRDLECAGCQSNWPLLFKFDFSKCAYQDYACTKALHPDDFIQATEILLEESK